MNIDKNALLQKLAELDFTAIDLMLYLDTHPTERHAISQYNETVKEADLLRAMYEKNYGPLRMHQSTSNPDSFSWIEGQWPWHRNDTHN